MLTLRPTTTRQTLRSFLVRNAPCVRRHFVFIPCVFLGSNPVTLSSGAPGSVEATGAASNSTTKNSNGAISTVGSSSLLAAAGFSVAALLAGVSILL